MASNRFPWERPVFGHLGFGVVPSAPLECTERGPQKRAPQGSSAPPFAVSVNQLLELEPSFLTLARNGLCSASQTRLVSKRDLQGNPRVLRSSWLLAPPGPDSKPPVQRWMPRPPSPRTSAHSASATPLSRRLACASSAWRSCVVPTKEPCTPSSQLSCSSWDPRQVSNLDLPSILDIRGLKPKNPISLRPSLRFLRPP